MTDELDPDDDADDDAPPPPDGSGGERNHISPAGHARLVAERDTLRTERHRVVEIVSWAAGNGDRSENADYQYGKRRLREIDRRLRFLGKRLQIAEIVDPSRPTAHDRVLFGATVTYATERDEQRRVTILGTDEAETGRGEVSLRSPIARALLGRRVGDVAILHVPSGPEEIELLAITYPEPPPPDTGT